MHPRIEALLRNDLWLAPMAGVGDPVFRALCLREGAGLTYTEMVSAKGLEYKNANTEGLLVLSQGETSCGVQLFGHEPDVVASAAARIAEKWGDALALIDINMGCPVPKVVKKGEGSALMKDPEGAAALVAAVARGLEPYGIPVTVKMRSGWCEGENSAPSLAARLEEAGASLITVHGRSRTQMYHGHADRAVIAATVAAVSIPVIGNGDVNSLADAASLKEETGCAGVMVARGAEGNPWVFSGHEASADEKLDCALEHARGLVGLMGPVGVRRIRQHVAFYVHGMPGAARMRAAVMQTTTLEELEGAIEAYRAFVHDALAEEGE